MSKKGLALRHEYRRQQVRVMLSLDWKEHVRLWKGSVMADGAWAEWKFTSGRGNPRWRLRRHYLFCARFAFCKDWS
jgi:hypothetical protein